MITATQAKEALNKLEVLKLRREFRRARWSDIFNTIKSHIEMGYRGCIIKDMLTTHEETLLKRLDYHIRLLRAGQFQERNDTLIAWGIEDSNFYIENKKK